MNCRARGSRFTLRCEAFPPDIMCRYLDGAYDLRVELGEPHDAQ